VIHSLTANIGQFKHCKCLVYFFLGGANVFTLDSNEHYFLTMDHGSENDRRFYMSNKLITHKFVACIDG
jgi:hypothetical protein